MITQNTMNSYGHYNRIYDGQMRGFLIQSLYSRVLYDTTNNKLLHRAKQIFSV